MLMFMTDLRLKSDQALTAESNGCFDQAAHPLGGAASFVQGLLGPSSTSRQSTVSTTSFCFRTASSSLIVLSGSRGLTIH
ncbi:MAG: hypothetical protein JWQ51_3458 [Tardiphaga sp.]|nr:hypothetical protein [Tardiphaga sp.]